MRYGSRCPAAASERASTHLLRCAGTPCRRAPLVLNTAPSLAVPCDWRRDCTLLQADTWVQPADGASQAAWLARGGTRSHRIGLSCTPYLLNTRWLRGPLVFQGNQLLCVVLAMVIMAVTQNGKRARLYNVGARTFSRRSRVAQVLSVCVCRKACRSLPSWGEGGKWPVCLLGKICP